MAVSSVLQRLQLGQFAGLHRGQMIPLGSRACYFCAALTLSEEDLHEYLTEPVASLPPAIAARLPRLEIFLVPYLERGVDAPGRARAAAPELFVAPDKPADAQSLASGFLLTESQAVLAFAVKDTEVADYHYRFYRTISELTARDRANFGHSKRCRAYIRRSFIDTLTLYLHGICCDIDVETGPRQLASNLLRKRLRLLRTLFPPPDGYAVLPEDLQPASRERPDATTVTEP